MFDLFEYEDLLLVKDGLQLQLDSLMVMHHAAHGEDADIKEQMRRTTLLFEEANREIARQLDVMNGSPIESRLRLAKLALSLISVPERWTKGDFARLNGGIPTTGTDKDAVCWCIHGALIRAFTDSPQKTNGTVTDVIKDLVAVAREEMRLPGETIHLIQDHPEFTHSHAVALFQRLIARYDPDGSLDPLRAALVSRRTGKL
jgi:hypothetical protein